MRPYRPRAAQSTFARHATGSNAFNRSYEVSSTTHGNEPQHLSEIDVYDVISDSLRLIAPALRKRRLEIRAAVDHVTLYADRSQPAGHHQFAL